MYSPADNADHADECSKSCIISQRKTDWIGGEVHSVIVFFVVIAVLGFVCDYLRELSIYLYTDSAESGKGKDCNLKNR